MKWKIGSMTLDILPPVKRYMYAIERRLHTDRKTRVRIMMELAGDFQSRRESGQSDEAIMQEMGTPDEVAAEFNASLGVQGTARVSPWRWAFAALAAVLLLGPLLELLLSRFWFSFSYPSGASGGVIGGADGPTAIYVATSFSLDSLLTLLPWLLGSVGGFRGRVPAAGLVPPRPGRPLPRACRSVCGGPGGLGRAVGGAGLEFVRAGRGVCDGAAACVGAGR